MQESYKDFAYLYSTKYFQLGEAQVKSAGFKHKIFFFLGLAILFLLFPLSAVAALILMAKVNENRIKNFWCQFSTETRYFGLYALIS